MKNLSFNTVIYMRWCAVVLSSALVMSILPGAKADYYAAQNGQAPAGTYTNWASAASNIQDAVNAATNYSTVWVGAGRYTLPPNATNFIGSNVVYINRSLTLRSSNSVPANTIIDGQGTNRGIAIMAVTRWTLDGFTISNCWATNSGGGIYVFPVAGTGTVQNCVISDNSVAWGTNATAGTLGAGGGGIHASSIAAFNYVISNCTFRNNWALSDVAGGKFGSGGAAYLSTYTGGSGKFINCLVESNSAATAGGIFFQYAGNGFSLENCVIRGNLAKYDGPGNASMCGGGIQLNGCGVVMRNCLMYNNVFTVAGNGGGGLASQAQGAYLIALYNCTIVSNYSGGIYIRTWGSAQGYNPYLNIYNSIIQSNTSYNISATPAPTQTNIIMNSCWYPTNGANAALLNIGSVTSPASFVNFAAQNFRLNRNSPCVNTGTNQDWMTNSVDLDGSKRIRYGTVDMGAYELIFGGAVYTFH